MGCHRQSGTAGQNFYTKKRRKRNEEKQRTNQRSSKQKQTQKITLQMKYPNNKNNNREYHLYVCVECVVPSILCFSFFFFFAGFIFDTHSILRIGLASQTTAGYSFNFFLFIRLFRFSSILSVYYIFLFYFSSEYKTIYINVGRFVLLALPMLMYFAAVLTETINENVYVFRSRTDERTTYPLTFGIKIKACEARRKHTKWCLTM